MPADAHELAQPAPVPALQPCRQQRAERHLLAVLGGARVQRVERVADQVLRARARTRRTRDLHREAAQDEPAQQAVQERRAGAPVCEVRRGRARRRGRRRSATAARRSRPPPRRPPSAARRQSTQRARVGEQVAEPRAGALRRRRGDHVEVDGDRDRQAAVAAAQAYRRQSRITLTGEAMPSAVSWVGTTISGSSALAQADLATSIVLPPPTATTASAARAAPGAAATRVHLGLGVGLDAERLRRPGAAAPSPGRPRQRRGERRAADHAPRVSKPSSVGQLAEQRAISSARPCTARR